MGTKLSFTARALRPGEGREAGHLIPAPGSVMGKWKSHSKVREAGGLTEGGRESEEG